MSTDDPMGCFARADLVLALAGALGPPSTKGAGWLSEVGRDVELLARAGFDDPRLAQVLTELGAAAAATDISEWGAEATRLFEAGAACPPNETAWVRRDKGAILGDVAAFQRAFGLEPAPTCAEKPDHVVAELELVALLLVMLGHARLGGREDDAEVVERALDAFAADHLGEWLPAFCLELSRSSPLPVYQALAEAVARTWDALARACQLDRVRGRPLPVVEHDPGSPYECGLADAGIA